MPVQRAWSPLRSKLSKVYKENEGLEDKAKFYVQNMNKSNYITKRSYCINNINTHNFKLILMHCKVLCTPRGERRGGGVE